MALPEPPRDFVLFEQFRADPQAHPLKTASGKLELHSEALAGFGYADCPPHPAWLPPAEWLGAEAAREWPLHLVTCQPAGRLHSQLDQSNAAREAEIAGREPVRMHPADARARGIGQGTWCACTTNAAPAWAAPTWTRAWRAAWWSWPRAPGSTCATRRSSATATRTC